jgi:hypothetical protein
MFDHSTNGKSSNRRRLKGEGMTVLTSRSKTPVSREMGWAGPDIEKELETIPLG